MASIEFIQKRIDGKEKELEKLNKKLERINKAKSFNYDDDHNPYCYTEHDLKWTLTDIEDAEKSLENYKQQLIAETEKDGSRNIQVILDFLEDWKTTVIKYYVKVLPEWIDTLNKYYDCDRECCNFYINRISMDDKKETLAELKQARAEAKAVHQKYDFLDRYVKLDYKNEREYSIDMDSLKSDLDKEAKQKYDFIIERTNAIVGQITDASGLSIGRTGDLNGYIYGTKGTASVNTISAEGDVQCFHYRTLIHKVK